MHFPHDDVPLPSSVDDLPDAATLAVDVGAGVQVNFFPGDDVVVDLDRRELEDDRAAAALDDVLRSLGRATGENVRVTHEGAPGLVALRYDVEPDELDVLQ